MSEARRDRFIALGLLVLTTLIVGLTSTTVGFTRDEGYYFKAAEGYWRWYQAFGAALFSGDPLGALSPAVIDKHWSYNFEHPAGMKTLFAWSFGILHEGLGVFSRASDAFRFPAWLMAGVSTAAVFLLGRALLPLRAALVAAGLWIAAPHVFWHMHVACFDVAIAAGHCWLVLAWWKGRHSVLGGVLCGVAFALAAMMKHNVLPVPALLVLHWALATAVLPPVVNGADAHRVPLPRMPVAFFAMALLAPALYLIHWPWLWPDPVMRIGRYLGFHLQHEHYPILWFGDLLTHPPFPLSFPFVMSGVTLPVPTLVLMLMGVGLAVAAAGRLLWSRFVRPLSELEITRVPLGDPAQEPSGSAAILLLINAVYPFVLIALPSTPIFGGTKHWMNALPFLCVLAAWALQELLSRVQWRRALIALLIAAVVLPGAVISARVWPFGLGSYNELIGFARGAANVGMQRTFWGYEPRVALPQINARAPQGGRIHFGDTNADDFRMYRRDGLLRSDLSFANTVRGAQVASVQPQGEFKDQWLDVWNEWRDRTPDIVLHAEGVPMCTVSLRGEP